MRGLMVVIGLLLVASVWSQRTTRRPKGVVVEQSALVADIDTVLGCPDSVRLAGFDKPLRSRKESFFATNKSARPVSEMALTFTYFDTHGRQLHSRHLRVSRLIEPGATVNITVPAWDCQQSLYYVRSEKPKRVQQATPFDVAISVDTVFIITYP